MNIIGQNMGIISMLIIIFGTLLSDPFTKNICFLIGSSGMTLYSMQIKHPIFTSMQWIILVGISLSFFPLENPIKLLILGTLCGINVANIKKKKKSLHPLNDFCGITSIIALALGYATGSPQIYLIGGIFATIYALLELRAGVKQAWIWALLNSTFVSTVTLQLLLPNVK